MKRKLLVGIALLAAGIAAACSSRPAPPRAGTPAFFWAAAKSTFHAGDYRKTEDNLFLLIRGDNEFTVRARPWAIVIAGGLAQGYSELADDFDAGARMNRANPTPFRKQATVLRSLASNAAMEFAEGVHLFLDKDKQPNVTLAFEFPSGGAAQPGGIKKVMGGALIQDSERELLLNEMLQRGVVLNVSRAVGSPDDTAKALEKFKTGEVSVPRATFLYAAAKSLFEQAELFGPTKLDQPNRLVLMCREATEALESIPETKETKQLLGKIQAARKKIKTT